MSEVSGVKVGRRVGQRCDEKDKVGERKHEIS